MKNLTLRKALGHFLVIWPIALAMAIALNAVSIWSITVITIWSAMLYMITQSVSKGLDIISEKC